MTPYLMVKQVLFIHAPLIEETVGGHGLRDLGLLESAVMRPRATFCGTGMYLDLFIKAAALLHSLIGNHPFVGGNKRIEITATGIFLIRNGINLTASHPELQQFQI